jgi:hypothetical protein
VLLVRRGGGTRESASNQGRPLRRTPLVFLRTFHKQPRKRLSSRATGDPSDRSSSLGWEVEGSAVAFGAVRIRRNREICLADARFAPWRFGVNPRGFLATWAFFGIDQVRPLSFAWPVFRNHCWRLCPWLLNKCILGPLIPKICMPRNDELETRDIFLREFQQQCKYSANCI